MFDLHRTTVVTVFDHLGNTCMQKRDVKRTERKGWKTQNGAKRGKMKLDVSTSSGDPKFPAPQIHFAQANLARLRLINHRSTWGVCMLLQYRFVMTSRSETQTAAVGHAVNQREVLFRLMVACCHLETVICYTVQCQM